MTLRDLAWAAEAREEFEWELTSHVLANQINVAAGKHLITAKEINPFRRQPAKLRPLTVDDAAAFFDL